MRTIRIKLYKFNELSESAKEKAIEDWRNSNNDTDIAWQDILGDGSEINLVIESLDDNRPNKGEFKTSATDTAKLILKNHGEMCDTYKTAQNFLSECGKIEKKAQVEGKDGDEDYWYSDEIEELENEFLQSLLEDYRIMLNKEIEYQNSDEYIKDTIEANEYEFTQDGKLN